MRLFRFYFANAFSVRNPQSRNCEVHAARNPSSRETGQREAAVCRTNRDPKNRRSGKTSTAAHSAGGNRHERAYGTETAASGPHCPDTDTAQLYRKVGTSSGQRKPIGKQPDRPKKDSGANRNLHLNHNCIHTPTAWTFRVSGEGCAWYRGNVGSSASES